MSWISTRWQRLCQLYHKDIWQPALLRDATPRGWFFALLRVLSIVWTVFNETKAASRAASLSYSSLLGLGPLVAIAVLVAGFVLDTKDPNLVVNTLSGAIRFVAPQVAQYEEITAPNGNVQVNQELVSLINGFIAGSRSGTAGTVGVLSLIFIVLMLFTSVENAFNEIWGVRRGRSWLTRIVFYWTTVSLGAVLFFTSLTAMGAGAYLSFFGNLEKHSAFVVLRWILPSTSLILVVAVLTLFYRFVPNTHVFWRAAFMGALVVTILVFVNNLMAFFYFRRVVQERSLYGSVGIVPILMLGLYVFWLFVLVGGQVSYAIQNVHFRNSQAAWGNLAEGMREQLSLVVLLSVCRRFQCCLEPCTASQLGDMIRVPTQIVNECINRLVDMRLITPVPPAVGAASNDYRFQPARPLNRITLQDFKRLDDSYGDDPTGDTLLRLDPILKRYNNELDSAIASDFFTRSVDQLLVEYPFDESHPPFSQLGAK